MGLATLRCPASTMQGSLAPTLHPGSISATLRCREKKMKQFCKRPAWITMILTTSRCLTPSAGDHWQFNLNPP